jgi:hypothetical protein
MVFYLLEDVLKPFVAAWILAYLLVPLVDRLGRYMPRGLAIVVSFLLIASVLTGLFLGLVPALQVQISAFLSQLPRYADQINRAAEVLASHLHLKADVSALGRGFEDRVVQLGTHLLQAPSELMSTAAQLIKTIIFIALVPVVSFLLLRDWHRLVGGLESFVRTSKRPSVEQFVGTANEVLRHYIHGQLLVLVGVGVGHTGGTCLLRPLRFLRAGGYSGNRACNRAVSRHCPSSDGPANDRDRRTDWQCCADAGSGWPLRACPSGCGVVSHLCGRRALRRARNGHGAPAGCDGHRLVRPDAG